LFLEARVQTRTSTPSGVFNTGNPFIPINIHSTIGIIGILIMIFITYVDVGMIPSKDNFKKK